MDIGITHLLDSLGWALLHSLWQGSLAFIIVVIIRTLFKNNAPSLRYASQLSVLVACFAAFLITFGLYVKMGLQTGDEIIGLQAAGAGSIALADLPVTISQTFSSGLSAMQSNLSVDAASLTPLIGILWCLGFAFMALRYAGAFMLTQRLRKRGLSNPSAVWANKFRTLVLNAGLPADIKLHISAYVSGPVTLGFIKPVVLVPVGFLTGLPQDQVEAILLHEIAHIRRYDYALNLVQTAIKTVFFFHPAIHYISRRIDIDREQACDDLAVAQSRNPGALVKGLASLRLQSFTHGFSMSASGGRNNTPLLDRLARLAGYSVPSHRSEHMIVSAVTALLIGSLYLASAASANAHPETAEIQNAYEDTQEKARELAQEQAQDAIERAQHARERAQEERERMLELEYEHQIREEHAQLHNKLYSQLLDDRMISPKGGTVTMKFVNDSWTVNGAAVPEKSETKYCRILANMGVRKAARTTIEVSSGTIHIVSRSVEGKTPQTHRITHGEFSQNRYGDGSQSTPIPPAEPFPHVLPVSPAAPTSRITPVLPVAPAPPSAPFIVPTTSRKVNVRFGMTDPNWAKKHTHGHEGIDLGAAIGSPVYASRDGKVSFVAREGGWGNRVIVKHTNGYQTLYAHLDDFNVKPGQLVTAGEIIGSVGSSGNSPGPHLHFEIRKNGTPLNPIPLIF